MFNTILIMFLFWLAPIAYAEKLMTRVGYAYSKDTSELLYTEHHHEVFDDKLVASSTVFYKDPSGNKFAQKTLNFGIDAFLPEFSLVNQANGHEETTRYLENKYEIFFLESKDERARKKELDYLEGSISDAGFDNFVIAHWDELVDGRKFTRKFLIPSMLRFIEFRIYQKEIKDQGDKSYRVLHIEPNSFFLRTLSGTVKLFYELDKPVLKKFQGTSNMRDARGKNYKVIIKYENTAIFASAD